MINEHCDCPRIKYEDINTVKELISPDDYMICFDVISGYHHLPPHVNSRKYLAFKWRDSFYMWKKVPFGWNLSAFYFDKTFRAIVSHFRSLNIKLVAYVDDFLLMTLYCMCTSIC